MLNHAVHHDAPDVRIVEVDADWPESLQPLFEKWRYKVAYGGRGGTKSWGFARALLVIGTGTYPELFGGGPIRILCCREIQKTIDESVHELLKAQIQALGLGSFYTVLDNKIIGINGTEFAFSGLRHLDATKIKSYEGFDIAWVEEAQTVRKRSWQILIPTIRKPGSEIWVSFNPELDTDDTWVRFIENTPGRCALMNVNYVDNPWFPEELEAERRHSKKHDDRIDYENIWEGKCRPAVKGAIFATEIAEMIASKRVRPVPFEPGLKVHTVWDLGWNDQTSILFVQRLLSEIRLINYLEASFLAPNEWAAVLNNMALQKGYIYAFDWLPHDAKHKTQAAAGKSTAMILRSLGRRVKIVPGPSEISREEGIRQVRMVLPRMYVDEDLGGPKEIVLETEDGTQKRITQGTRRWMECMKRYRRTIPAGTEEPSAPAHDPYSHGADATRHMSIVVHKMTNDDLPPAPKGVVSGHVPADPGAGY